MYTITQNNTVILSSEDGWLRMIFNNLIGRNIKGAEYRTYIADMKGRSELKSGQIEFCGDGEVLAVGVIK